MPEERRHPDPDIALIKKDVAYIREFIKEDRDKMKEHIETSEIFRDKVNKLSAVSKEFDSHVVQDRWIQGLILTGVISIIIRLVLFK